MGIEIKRHDHFQTKKAWYRAKEIEWQMILLGVEHIVCDMLAFVQRIHLIRSF